MLHKLGMKYGTDKATAHGYTHVYEKKFGAIREEVKTFMEIGTAWGRSTQMWKYYFTNASIYALDIRDIYEYDDVEDEERVIKCTYNFGKRDDDDNSHTHQEYKLGDDNKGLNTFKKDYPIEFDIIVEDGSHMMKDQQLSLAMLFDQVKSGGIYVVEDLATSHKLPRWARYKKPGDTNTLDMLHAFNETGEFHSVHMTDEEMQYLNENVESCEIFEMPTSTKATLAFLRKK